jgi:hypothetical protein
MKPRPGRRNMKPHGKPPAALAAALFGASFLVFAGPARADVIIQDELTSSTDCTDPAHCGVERAVGGTGTFGASGWTVNTVEDRIRYDFGRAITCGTAIFTVSGMDPFDQFVVSGTPDPQYAEWAGLTELETGSHWDIGTTVILLLYTPCLGWDDTAGDYVPCDPDPDPLRYNVRLNTGLLNPEPGPDSCGDWSLNDRRIFQPDPATYTFRIDWDQSGVWLYVDDTLTISVTYPTYPSDCRSEPKSPDIRYLFLGQTGSSLGHLVGPTYSNVSVQSCDIPEEEGVEESPDTTEPEALEEAGPDVPETQPDEHVETADTAQDVPADAGPDTGGGAEGGCGCSVIS